uniref:Uncharacterized protein n=1 Tax=Arundo donax TaxID=35708 RepID=A0A0A8Y6X2_ARUDO
MVMEELRMTIMYWDIFIPVLLQKWPEIPKEG